jgi:hypothetical protein
MRAMRHGDTVTGSRRADLALFALLAALIVVGSLRLRVYYQAPAPRAAPGASMEAGPAR